MDEAMLKRISSYASMVLEWLDQDSKIQNIHRGSLVEQFIDTLQALEQWKSQEE